MRAIFRGVRRVFFLLLILFVMPAIVSLAYWKSTQEFPTSWRTADWSSSKMLKHAKQDEEAVVYVMVARTGRAKGALSVHSWVVTKAKNAMHYNRYDKVGWGRPVRLNAYAPDARWYSNAPQVIAEFRGLKAEVLIPKIEAAISTYPYSNRGDYSIWPGPNSNTFVAHILDEVAEMNLVLPANAVGRDYRPIERWLNIDDNWENFQVSLAGYAGINIGIRSGFELSFLGLVSGFDFSKLILKIPGFGDVLLGAPSGVNDVVANTL